jgi:hypothetical protein
MTKDERHRIDAALKVLESAKKCASHPSFLPPSSLCPICGATTTLPQFYVAVVDAIDILAKHLDRPAVIR